MNLELTDEQRDLREVFHSLFAKHATSAHVRAAEPLGHDVALWEHIVHTGALGIGIDEKNGGAGGGLLELALVAEEAGRRVAPVPFAEPAAAARLLARYGDDTVLKGVLDGTMLLSLATGTVPLESQLLVDGAVADAVLVLDGDKLVVARRPDTVSHLANVGSLPMARWLGADTEIVASGPDVVGAFAAALDDARVLRAAALTGLALEAIEIGAAYARQRQAFGIAIGAYQGVAHPLADAVVAADGAQLLMWKACWALTVGVQSGPALAVMALQFAGQAAYAAAQHSLHLHGGYGFTAEYDIQLYYRRAKAWRTVFGDPNRELAILADRLYGSRAGPVSVGGDA